MKRIIGRVAVTIANRSNKTTSLLRQRDFRVARHSRLRDAKRILHNQILGIKVPKYYLFAVTARGREIPQTKTVQVTTQV